MRACLLFIAAIICMSASCGKKEPVTDPKNCDGVMCTQMFKMITLRITDASGNAVKLDDYYTLHVASGEKAKVTGGMNGGYYTVVDDSRRKDLQDRKVELKFVGMKDGKEVVNETYMVTADCCHIEKISGKTEIVLQ
ncbi:MAG: hypothetical protein EOP56_10130 [Sphingobacteriales bacterium]|nr:MAG: hypothetical protein EOP56_10130 [Sphingobacteriales bacterium]